MADDTTVTIGIKANIEGFKKSMQEAKKSVKTTGKAMSEQAEKMSDSMKESFGGENGGLQAFSNAIKGVSPTLDGVMGSIGDMKNRFKEAGKAGKMAMLGVKVAIGGLAVGIIGVLGKAIMDTTGKFAAMTDPARFDKNMSAMKESVRTLKTSIGELASPVFEYMSKGVKALADGLNWVVERMAMFVGLLQGLLGLGHKVNQTIAGTAEGMEEAGIAADAGLASFDKLNTLNIGEMGDMEQAEKIAGLMDKMRAQGKDLAKKIKDAVQPINDVLGGIKEVFSMNPGELWDRFKEAAIGAWEGVKAWGSDAWENIKESAAGVWSSISGWAGNTWANITESASKFWSSVVEWGSNTWDSVKEKAMNVWGNITTSVKGAWDGIKSHIVERFQAVGSFLKGMFQGVVNVFKSAWDRAFGAIRSAIDWILDKIRWVSDKISSLKNSISNIGSKAKNWVSSKVEGVKGALGFAQGGLFQPNSPQLVMVGDNKTEPEVIAPRSMIMDAMRQVIAETGAMSRREDITLEIDGRTLARHIIDDLEFEDSRRGRGTIA